MKNRKKIIFVCEQKSKGRSPRKSSLLQINNIENSINNNDDNKNVHNIHNKQPKTKPTKSKKVIKRKNKNGCKFNLQFDYNYNQLNDFMKFNKSSMMNHNHSPKKCSIEYFKSQQKNIKFSFQLIMDLSETIVYCREKLTIDLIKSITDKFKTKYLLSEGNNYQIVMKKYRQLINYMKRKVETMMQDKIFCDLSNDFFLKALRLKFISTNASVYLRQEDTEELKQQLE